MKTIAFNTGRQYDQHGQRIVAKVLSQETDEFGTLYRFAFVDLSRGIPGRATCFGAFNATEIMRAYDNGQYQGTWSNADFENAEQAYNEAMAKQEGKA